MKEVGGGEERLARPGRRLEDNRGARRKGAGHLRQDWPDWQVGQGHRAAVAAYSRRMEMISTGSTGTSRIPFFTPVLTPEMASTTSMPEVTWPKTA